MALITTATLISAAVSAALSVGLSIIQSALAKKKKSNTDSLDFGTMLSRRMRTGEPLEVLVGQRITAGVASFDNSWDVNNERAVSVTLLSAKPCTAFHQLFLDGEPVTLDGDPTQAEVNVTSHFLGKNNAPRTKFRLFLNAEDEACGAFLAAKFPDQYSATDTHGDYCVMVTECRLTNDDVDEETGKDDRPFQQFPDVKVELSGVEICDPRAGGVYGDEATYTYSSNAALIDAMCDFGWYSGIGSGRKMIIGNGYDVGLMSLTQIGTNANYCDIENLTCNGIIRSGSNSDQTEVQKCYNAERVEHPAEVFCIPEGNREDGGEIDMSLYPAAYVDEYRPDGYSTEIYNQVSTSYAEPLENYIEKRLPVYFKPEWIAADDNILRQMPLPLLFVTNLDQAAKLEQQEIEMSRRPATVMLRDLPQGFRAKKVGTVITVRNSDTPGINDKIWIIKGKVKSVYGDIDLMLREFAGSSVFTYDEQTDRPTVTITPPVTRSWEDMYDRGSAVPTRVTELIDGILDGTTSIADVTIDDEGVSVPLFEWLNDNVSALDFNSIIDGLAATFISSTIRLEEIRNDLGRFGVVDGIPIGTVINRTETLISETNLEIARFREEYSVGVEGLGALIIEERTARQADGEASAQSRLELSAQIGQGRSDIANIRRTVANNFTVSSEAIDALRSTFNGYQSTFISRIQTLVDADQALSARQAIFSASLDQTNADLTGERGARVEADNAAAFDRQQLRAQLAASEASILALREVDTDLQRSLAADRAEYLTSFGQATAALAVERSARTAADQAINRDLLTMQGRIRDVETGVSASARAVQSIQSGVTRNKNDLISFGTVLEQLDQRLTDNQGLITAQAGSIREVATSITAINDTIVSQAAFNQSINASVGSLVAGVNFLASAVVRDGELTESALVFRTIAGSNEARVELFSGSTYGGVIRLSADQIEIQGDVIIDGTLTARQVKANALTHAQVFQQSGSLALDGSGYQRVIGKKMRSEGNKTVVNFTFRAITSGECGVFSQVYANGVIVGEDFFYSGGAFNHSVTSSFAMEGIADNASIELKVAAFNGANASISGVTIAGAVLMTTEFK